MHPKPFTTTPPEVAKRVSMACMAEIMWTGGCKAKESTHLEKGSRNKDSGKKRKFITKKVLKYY